MLMRAAFMEQGDEKRGLDEVGVDSRGDGNGADKTSPYFWLYK